MRPGATGCAVGTRSGERVITVDFEQHDPGDYPADVAVARVGDREILLVGTAHVSRESAELVRRVIRQERPDHVCVELDARRYEALSQKQRWENLDLKQLIRRRQLTTLLANLLLASYQKKIAGKLGVVPGTELLEAVRAAEEAGTPFTLCDRDIRVTMLRAWRAMSLVQKWKILGALVASLFSEPEISEDDLRELRRRDVVSELMQELAQVLPALKRVLIDERDHYLARKILAARGDRIVAVVGAGHVQGILQALREPADVDLDAISSIPPVLPVWKWVGWGVPLLIVGSLVAIAWTQGGNVAGRNLLFWVLANGIPSALGAALALAHPLTILAAFLAAPITSLTPVIGAGYVTAFVQANFRPPRVRDFQRLSDESIAPRNWWTNRLLQVFLAFLLPSLGSMVGTALGGYKIVSTLFA